MRLHKTSVTPRIVKKVIKNLELSKASSPDSFPVVVLKNCESKLWIPNPWVLCSKLLGGFKVNSAFHHSEVDKTSTRNFWELAVKSKLPP